jgi:hypothetical protein
VLSKIWWLIDGGVGRTKSHSNNCCSTSLIEQENTFNELHRANITYKEFISFALQKERSKFAGP